MARQRVNRRRVKIGATLDPTVLGAVDAFIRGHPGLDRSAVIDEALRLWWAQQQDTEMEEQFGAPVSTVEREERSAWKAIQDTSARRIFHHH